MTHIRLANLNDAIDMLPLFSQLGYPVSLEQLEKRLNNFLQIEGYGLALAVVNAKIVGLVAWSKLMILVAGKTRLRIEGLIVNENYRGKNIGKQLMLYVEDLAKQYSGAAIELTSGVRRAKDGSHEFYKSLGYSNAGLMAKMYFKKEIN